MSRHRFALLALSLFASFCSSAQEPPFSLRQSPPWILLTDPVCPVSKFSGVSVANATSTLRVMYFPKARDAKIKSPEKLTLSAAFDGPNFAHNSTAIPFTRNDDRWEAVVPIERHLYAIFYVKDDKDVVDDNNGQLWDVVFCEPDGKRSIASLMQQAETYTGKPWPEKVHRAKDYAKAVSILQSAAAGDAYQRYTPLMTQLWHDEALRDGDDTQAWTKVSNEVSQFLIDHPDDKAAAFAVAAFISGYEDHLPEQFVERTLGMLDKVDDRKHSLLSEVELSRARRIRAPRLQAQAMQAWIGKYPDSDLILEAVTDWFFAMYEAEDIPGAEAAFAKYRDTVAKHKDLFAPNTHVLYQAMAQVYADKGVQLDRALKLLDDDLASLRADPRFDMEPEFKKHVEAQYSEIRARAYLGLHKPDLALTEAKKASEVLNKNAQLHFDIAQACAALGEKRSALDEYFEAALMPSNKDLTYRAELRQFFIKNFGDEEHFEAELNRRIAARFAAANYVPKLIEQPAPALEFTTLKGERFEASALSAKTVVINFWSPG